MDFGLEIQKNNDRIRIGILEVAFVPIFQEKCTTLTFLAQISPKMDLELKIQKINVEIRINILEIQCAPIFRQNKLL